MSAGFLPVQIILYWPCLQQKVAKLFLADTRSEIGSEAEKMKFANEVNDLVVKFIPLDYNDELQAGMLVMERLYPIDFRAYEAEKRELWIELFEDELKALHRAGFVHRDMGWPSGLDGLYFNNILMTDRGLRLIDEAFLRLRVMLMKRYFPDILKQS